MKWRLTSMCFAALLVPLLFAASAFPQALTGTITGRALDSSGGVLPGVELAVSSPALIGGPRSTVTDAQGVYRVTQLPRGVYRVSFKLTGFKTLNVEEINLDVGATMTINGTLQIDALSEEVTVISDTPVIDLQATTVGVNWDEKQMENLPYGRGIRGLARLVPGLSPTQFDVGGNTVGGSTTTGARNYGRSGQELIKFDGVVWDQFFGDYNTYDQVQISNAAKGAEAQSPGATLSFVIKSGSNNLSGAYLLSWQDGAFQGNNVTADLRARGFDPGNNKFTRYNDISLDLGGPILRDKLWFYGAYGYNYSGLYIPGFISLATGDQVEYFTRLDNPTLKLTYQISQNNKFELSQQFNRKWQPYRNASRFVPLEASQNQIAWTAIGPAAKFTRILSNSMTFDVGFNRSGYWWPDYAWTDDVRKMDLTTTTTRGAFLEVYRKPIRWGYNGTYSWFTNIKEMNHEFKTGFLGYHNTNYLEQYGYPNQQIYRYRSLAGENDLFLHPDSVQVFDYPNNTNSGVNFNSWFLNDLIALSKQLTLNAGVRFDRYSSWLPEQGNPGVGPYAEKNLYSESHNFPIYNAWSPRLSLIYDLRGNGRVALKASYGRYAAAGSGVNASSGPVASDVNPAATRTTTYRWNGTIPYIPNPADLQSVAGGRGDRRLDSNLKAAGMDEYTGGVDFGLSRDLNLRFTVVRKLDWGGSKELDLAMPYEAFTDRRTAVDPGRDNIVGTPDDGVVEVWSVPRSYPTFGQVIRLTTNTEPGEGEDKYWAFETTASKRYSNGWSLLASYSIDRRDVRNFKPRNPNEALYGQSNGSGAISDTYPPDLPQTYQGGRLSGTYELPWKMMVAATLTLQQGEYFPRIIQVQNALNSLVEVVAEGQAGRYDWVKLMDLRFSKTLTFGKQSLEGMFDVFNLTNTSVVLRHINVNGPNYLKPLATSGIDAASANPIPAPRIFRLSVRYKF
ncbi:MAG TPA: carboxypeptidase regulatory-like domain-containing protein [Vicinamibacterales bacterium]|nr:carboxypeptidase regulatory-like domain-containing protein [Vicinamibacterales bacterium]